MFYRQWALLLAEARDEVKNNVPDAEALARIGRWYASQGVGEWAIPMLNTARRTGADIDPLTLGQCYWQADQLPAALDEYRRAFDAKQASPVYLSLCRMTLTAASR